MRNIPSPDQSDLQVLYLQGRRLSQRFTPLDRRRGCWFANHALQRSQLERRGCNFGVLLLRTRRASADGLFAGSLSLGR